MNNNANIATINFRNPGIVRKLGIAALTKELGVVGMAYFIRQFDAGSGDYTAERDEWLEGITAEEILKSAYEIESNE
jgi:hypothetical protein